MTSDDYASLLTPRKLAVARYVAQGFSNKQIAAILGLSIAAIKQHIAGIARIWRLDLARNLRVQITQRILLACDVRQSA